MTIRWDESMATGEKNVDAQHRQLIANLDRLVNAMSAGRGREEIEPVLDALRQYVATHFAYEEDCMRRVHCPVAERNAQAHARFSTTFRQIDAEYQAKGASSVLTIRVQRELAEWLTTHIKGTDAHLRECLRAV